MLIIIGFLNESLNSEILVYRVSYRVSNKCIIDTYRIEKVLRCSALSASQREVSGQIGTDSNNASTDS